MTPAQQMKRQHNESTRLLANGFATKAERKAELKAHREYLARVEPARCFGANFQAEMAAINAEYEKQRKRTLASLARTNALLSEMQAETDQ